MASQDGLNSELESFRQQWLSDLRSKNEAPADTSHYSALTARSVPHPHRVSGPPPPSPSSRPKAAPKEDDDEAYLQGPSFDEPPQAPGRTLAEPTRPKSSRQLVSALDHYEEAMEKEAAGNMGESLNLYRKAYRMDNRVDRRYREKHYPTGVPAPKNLATSAPSSEGQPVPGTTVETTPQPIGDLIAGFSDLKIEPAKPEVEGMPQPPCPLADLPDELLIHILQDVAVEDVGDFVRLSRVCKHFAYLVSVEQRIWRRVDMGSEFGFGGMHYHWQKGIEWDALEEEEEEDDDGALVSISEVLERRTRESILFTKSLVPTVYSSWKEMFRSRPRLRFNGCYISTVNYIRAGQASTNQLTWNSPIHIVTYFRYLRFYRDGTAISLLTTSEPGDVVHHVTKESLEQHRDGSHSYLPSSMMTQALKGRWRLSSAMDQPEAPPHEQESDLYIETQGVGPKYMYRMDLSLRSAGKGTKNNKLVWRGFYSYNKLTDDWAPFGMKNYRPFFFSRVKSYGKGE